MRCLFGWTLALACSLSLISTGCSNKGVELPKADQTVGFKPGVDPEGLPAGGPGKGSGGGGSTTGLKKWQGQPAPSAPAK